jgi:hypothetical protein
LQGMEGGEAEEEGAEEGEGLQGMEGGEAEEEGAEEGEGLQGMEVARGVEGWQEGEDSQGMEGGEAEEGEGELGLGLVESRGLEGSQGWQDRAQDWKERAQSQPLSGLISGISHSSSSHYHSSSHHSSHHNSSSSSSSSHYHSSSRFSAASCPSTLPRSTWSPSASLTAIPGKPARGLLARQLKTPQRWRCPWYVCLPRVQRRALCLHAFLCVQVSYLGVEFHEHPCLLGLLLQVAAPQKILDSVAGLPTHLLEHNGGGELSNESKLVVGRWGEAYVAEYLRQHPDVLRQGWRVDWVNEDEETGRPYDILIRTTPEGTKASRADVEGEGDIYVEVKTTCTSGKEAFEFSRAEMELATRKRSAYWVYRVSRAGSLSPVIVPIQDPVLQWERRRVGMLMRIRGAPAPV